jgi:hypothetical protein
MVWERRTLGAVLVASAVLAAGLWQPSSALAKPCGDVTVGSRTVVVGGAGVGCKFMRSWTKRLMRGTNREPAGWNCKVRSRTSGGCDRRHSRDFFIYYPPD